MTGSPIGACVGCVEVWNCPGRGLIRYGYFVVYFIDLVHGVAPIRLMSPWSEVARVKLKREVLVGLSSLDSIGEMAMDPSL